MKYVVRCMGASNGSPCGSTGKFVERYEPQWNSGMGYAWFTSDVSEALTFDTLEAAYAFWRTVPANRPTRPDGKPNRPLTAFHIEVVPLAFLQQ
jgi:hypothetical protein